MGSALMIGKEGTLGMKKLETTIWMAALALLAIAAPAWAQNQGQGHAVVTVLPAHAGEMPASVSLQDVKIKVSGRPSTVTGWTPLRGTENPLELVLLIDGSASSSLGEQFGVISGFVREMPSFAKIAIAYMRNGQAVLAGPLSADSGQVLRELHMAGGSAGSNASPYFSLSDLARHWPSTDPAARREVVMITDGVDGYQKEFDPDDPYVHVAITDSLQAGLVVYSMYWTNRGMADRNESISMGGQSLLLEVTDATGGNSYWEGMGNPVSFDPFFADLRRRLQSQYLLSFSSRLDGKPEVESLKLQLSVPAKTDAPRQVYVRRADATAR
jgi:hypothetical protein